MIISDSNKFIFLHIPKCGGTTIRNSLKGFDTRNNFFWMHTVLPGATENKPKLRIDKAHMTIPIFKRLFPDDFKLTSEYTVFSFSRNPIKRLISSFWEPRRKLLAEFNQKKSDVIFKNEIKAIFNSYLKKLVNQSSFLNPSFLHSTPQYMYISEGKKVITDIIIKLDEPTEGINALRVLLPEVAEKISFHLSNSKLNKSSSESYFLWDEAPNELKLNYLDKFVPDFDLLGYEKPIINE